MSLLVGKKLYVPNMIRISPEDPLRTHPENVFENLWEENYLYI